VLGHVVQDLFEIGVCHAGDRTERARHAYHRRRCRFSSLNGRDATNTANVIATDKFSAR
jgi:hypothetical protein